MTKAYCDIECGLLLTNIVEEILELKQNIRVYFLS